MGVNCATVFKAEPVNGEIPAINLGECPKEDESKRLEGKCKKNTFFLDF